MLNTCPHDLETPELELQGLLKMGKNRHFWGQKSRFRGHFVECIYEGGSFKTASYGPRHKNGDFSMRKYFFDKPSELGTLYRVFCEEKNFGQHLLTQC